MVPATAALSHHRPSSEANKAISQLVGFNLLLWCVNTAIECVEIRWWFLPSAKHGCIPFWKVLHRVNKTENNRRLLITGMFILICIFEEITFFALTLCFTSYVACKFLLNFLLIYYQTLLVKIATVKTQKRSLDCWWTSLIDAGLFGAALCSNLACVCLCVSGVKP